MVVTTGERTIVELLCERQRKEGLTDAAFAAKLGISRSYWTMLRLGRKQTFGISFIEGVVRAYPDLTLEALFFLRRSVAQRTDADANSDGAGL